MLGQHRLSRVFIAIMPAIFASNALSTNIDNNQEKTVDYLWVDTSTNVGLESDGTLNVGSGGDVQTNFINIGRSGANGVVNVYDGGKLTVSASSYSYPFDIGGSLNGTSSQSNGGVGTLNISGQDSIVSMFGDHAIQVGAGAGSGVINISDGGKLRYESSDLSFGGVWIGGRRSSSQETFGSINVDGIDSELWSAGRIIVGAYGSGSLLVSNGGTAHAENNINIGNQADTLPYDNIIRVVGDGSSATAGAWFSVGLSGKGSLVVSQGGVASAPEIRIGSSINSQGELAIGGRVGEDSVAAGAINAQKIIFGSGNGVLTLNHTSTDFELAADISGKGTINVLSGVSALSGDNSGYQGSINIDAPATLVISDQKNTGTNDILMTGGVLEIDTAQDWQFINSLTGQGTLDVNAGGNNFDFSFSTLTENFDGVLNLKNTLFSLVGTNTEALKNIVLNLGAGSVAKVGTGQQTIGGLDFTGGTLVFGDVAPGQTAVENTVHTTGTLDISGQGTVQITTGGAFNNDIPTPVNSVPLMMQDEGNILVQLASGTVVTGSGGNLTLTDQNGNTISKGGVTSDIVQNGNVVAQGTYDYRLTGGDSGNGLYVSYGLTQVDLLGQGYNALVLTSEGRTGNSADLSAKLTGSGDLAIDSGEGNTVSLSNLDNDYSGVTDIRSGTLLMRNDNVLGNTLLLQMAQGSGLEMNGHYQTVGSVDIAEDTLLNIDGGSLVINQGGQITGELVGSGSLVLNGGTLDVNGANQSLTAEVAVAENATVNLNSVQGIGAGAVELAGLVNLNATDGTLANSLSSTGTLALRDSQILLAGDNSKFGGTFTIDADSNLTASSASHLGSAGVENSGLLTLSTDENWQLDNRVSGAGGLRKEGMGIVALGTDSTLYSGTTDLLQGGLIFGAVDNPATMATSLVNIHEAGVLTGNGLIAGSVSNQGVLQVGVNPQDNSLQQTQMLTVGGNLINSGLVQLARTYGSAQPGNQIVVEDDYTGSDGRMAFNTVLNGDASATDHMTVIGNTSGVTRVAVANAGGTGAQTLEGIELINVGGRSDGEFIQDGRIVAGAYDYSLVRGEGASQGNWYLTSMTETTEPEKPGVSSGEPQLRPEMGSYIANQLAANTLFMTRLHDRLGESQYTDVLTGEQSVTSLWLRQAGGHTRFKDDSGQLATQSNRYILQVGGDLAQWSTDNLNRWHFGLMIGYANNQNRSTSDVTGFTSRGQVNGYSAGMYGTWYANDEDKNGTYIDTWALYNWFDNTVSGQEQVTEKYKSSGVTASVEAGYSLKVGESERDTYWIQPKAQIVWMGVKADDHQEQNGTQVKDDTGGNLMTRLGLRGYINGHNALDDGNGRTFQPFAEVNWLHNTHETSVTMNGVRNEMRGTKNAGEVKIGAEGQITSRLNLWGNVAQQVGDKGYLDTQGTLGIKYVW